MKYIYYPGCSQKATSRHYEKSFLAVAERLGVELEEAKDWNCCGATMAVSQGKVLSLSLAARNLAQVEKRSLPAVTPCPSCWLSFRKVNRVFQEDAELAGKVQDALSAGNLEYRGTAEVRHALDFFVNVVGIEKIREKVTSPLTGLKVAPYYGCQVVRPYPSGDDPENPRNLEKLIEALGARPADFPMRTACCGSSLMVTRKEVAETMSLRILKTIHEAKADLIVTPCGLCQVNLELAQDAGASVLGTADRIPVLTVSQLIGLGLGISPKELGVRLPVSLNTVLV